MGSYPCNYLVRARSRADITRHGANHEKDGTTSMTISIPADILTFYAEHPINEAQILNAVESDGKALDALTASDLFAYDQDHYGGTDATMRLGQAAALEAGHRVLDICSGMGGPARFFAHNFGCRVTGVDINQPRVLGAARLTGRVDLTGQVGFVCGNAMQLPFGSGLFHRAVAQEAFLHIPDKAALFSEIHRILVPEGRLAFTDWIGQPRLTSEDRDRLANTIMAKAIHSPDEYKQLIRDAGFASIDSEDLTTEWKIVLRERLEMYRSLEAETVRQFGPARHRAYIDAYEFFVAAIETDKLGGIRMVASR